MTTNEKARVIVTLACPRACTYCCNQYPKVKQSMRPLGSLDDLVGYREVLLTGGEPMLWPGRVLQVAFCLRSRTPRPKVYVYMSTYLHLEDVGRVLDVTDGIHYTLHHPMTADDQAKFSKFQEFIKGSPKSFRLKIHPALGEQVLIVPNRWVRVEVKPFLGEDVVKVPIGEDLFLLEGA